MTIIPALILLFGFGVFSFLLWDTLGDLRKLIAGPYLLGKI